ncbi:S1/P1 nuclease [Ferruginibacter albus]|uniref:S1/P1 nuclease n=1 Tax=Ferruginibacter albus TaxID=2875540 RepID=UPI001CC74D72|nr:S1/P1 nuclease [Ferruginibacter albus]UAY53628.1 hypothetical protein K9M53_08155 [Ferruginibacter albus]
MKKVVFIAIFLFASLYSKRSFAWGKTGHEIVPEIAFYYLDSSVKKNVLEYLANTSIEDAANWMDNKRSDGSFDYMKPWHYVDFEKGTSYNTCSDNNIVWELQHVLRELSYKNTLPEEEVRLDLLILFHLIGDLHQPLHCGYAQDRGGNDIKLTFLTMPSNLHKVWDEGIIDNQHISMQSCIAFMENDYKLGKIKELATADSLNVIDWLNDSRSLLDSVYDFKDNDLTMDYCLKNKAVIQKQLFIAGIRLAAILKKYFSNAPAILPKEIIKTPKGTISADDAISNIGSKKTVCGKVFGGKYFQKDNGGGVTLINVGAPYPNSPFTIVIFADDRKGFSYKPEEFLNGKTVCVTGTIKEFHGKAEIIVSREGDIEIQ